jgi:hypothetical protein
MNASVAENIIGLAKSILYEHGPWLWSWIVWGLKLRKAQLFAMILAVLTLALLPRTFRMLWKVCRWTAVGAWDIFRSIWDPIWLIISPVVEFLLSGCRALMFFILFAILTIVWLNALDWTSDQAEVSAFFRNHNHTYTWEVLRNLTEFYHKRHHL